MYDSNASRRAFLKQTGALAAVAIGAPMSLIGCSKKRAVTKPIALSFYATGTLDILEEGWARALQDAELDVRFTDNGNDTGPVIAQMISGTASKDHHVGGLQGGAEHELHAAGAVLPWDLSKIPNWQHVWSMAKEIPYARIDGKQVGLPIALNADSVIYRPDKIKEIPGYENGIVDSYSVIFDERLRGRTSMEDAWINSVIFAAIYLKENHLMAITDPGNLSEAELSEVMAFLIRHKKAGQFRKLWRGWEQGVDLIASGEVIAMTGWEPIVYELRRRGIEVEYAEPKEGYEGWSNDLLLHAGVGGGDLFDAAHELANWLYGGYYGCQLATLRGYAVPSDRSVAFARESADFDEVTIQSLSDHVKGKFERGGGATYWQNVRPKNYRLYEEKWNELRQA